MIFQDWSTSVHVQIQCFQLEKKRARARWIPCTDSLLRCPWGPALSWVEAKGWVLKSGLLCGWQRSNCLSHHHGFPCSVSAGRWSQEPAQVIQLRHSDTGSPDSQTKYAAHTHPGCSFQTSGRWRTLVMADHVHSSWCRPSAQPVSTEKTTNTNGCIIHCRLKFCFSF